jgi:hypothetical protein
LILSVGSINTDMKISEILRPKTPSAINSIEAQDLVPQDVVALNNSTTTDSAIAEGIKRVLRRVAGKGLKQGFRCTSGPRKGRVVAQSTTCNARLNPLKGAKIAQKRQRVAKQTAMKRSRTMRAGGASRRLKGIQIGRGKGTAPLKKSSRLQKSRIVKPKKK